MLHIYIYDISSLRVNKGAFCWFMLYDKFELTKVKLSFKFMRITELFKTVVKARITRQSHFTVKPASPSTYKVHRPQLQKLFVSLC